MEQVSGPLLRTVLALDQVAVGTLLQRHVARLQVGCRPCFVCMYACG